jgi:Fe-S-cluster containining protein
MENDSYSVESLHLSSEQQKAVEFLTEFSKQLVVMAFLEKNIPTSPSSLVKELYQVYDEVIAGCLRNGTKLPCKKGCSWCCFLRVKVTPLEILCMIDYLQSNLKPVELSAFRHRLADTDKTTRGMNGSQRVYAKKICPLIVENECLVYPVRPIACRTYHSLDMSDCESSLSDDQRSLRISPKIFGIGMGILTGLTEGLQIVGLQAPMLELIAGLRMAMDEPRLTRKWLVGESAFSGAEYIV